MDEKLQTLIRQLRDEQCPPAVLDRVAQRISREKAPPRSLRASVVGAVFIVCLLGAFALWQGRARYHAQRLAAARAAAQEQERARRLLVVQQTQEAFGCIGQALIRVADRTENALLKEAIPPLRNGFEIVKTKVTNPI
jgi:hypothetical protein